MTVQSHTSLSVNLDTVAQELGERSDVHNLHEDEEEPRSQTGGQGRTG